MIWATSGQNRSEICGRQSVGTKALDGILQYCRASCIIAVSRLGERTTSDMGCAGRSTNLCTFLSLTVRVKRRGIAWTGDHRTPPPVALQVRNWKLQCRDATSVIKLPLSTNQIHTTMRRDSSLVAVCGSLISETRLNNNITTVAHGLGKTIVLN